MRGKLRRITFEFLTLCIIVLDISAVTFNIKNLPIGSTVCPDIETVQMKFYVLNKIQWQTLATNHADTISSLVYPSPSKKGMQQVSTHPIFNFLHHYYDFSVQKISKYSPGVKVLLEGASAADFSPKGSLHHKYAEIYESDTLDGSMDGRVSGVCYVPRNIPTSGPSNHDVLSRSLNILTATAARPGFYGCFGLHEWAMLYTGRKSGQLPRHQENLPLRVDEVTINNLVESRRLSCTHFDAWRFFHPEAQALNIHNPMSRQLQNELEQPACIHANMDLFKYAYLLYPLLPASLLVESLLLALDARTIDMRASPYDVRAYTDNALPIAVETDTGRKLYIQCQEELATRASAIRTSLIAAYRTVLNAV